VTLRYTAAVRASRSIIKLTAIYQKVPEGLIGFVEKLPGANT
jgi:hypothetical protein